MTIQEQIAPLRRANGVFFLWIDKEAVRYISQHMGSSVLLVYLWLCFYAHSVDQLCYPSITTLAKNAYLGRRKVVKAIKELEKAGIIAVERRIGEVNVYRLLHFDFSMSAAKSLPTGRQVVENPVKKGGYPYPYGHGR